MTDPAQRAEISVDAWRARCGAADNPPEAQASTPTELDRLTALTVPAALCSDGDVVEYANEPFARLLAAGGVDDLIGKDLGSFLVRAGALGAHRLSRLDGSETTVRLSVWPTGNGRDPALRLVLCTPCDEERPPGEAVPAAPAAPRAARVPTGQFPDVGWLTDAQDLAEAERLAGVGSWTYDPATEEMYFSQGALEMFARHGYDLDDPLANVHPNDRDATATLINDAGRNRIEMELRDLTGEHFFMLRARPDFDESGEVIRWLGTLQDVTTIRENERRLRERLRRSEDAERVAMLGIWEWDPVTDECRWSETMAALVGVSSDLDLTYGSYLSFVHPDDRQWVDRLWRQLAVKHEPVSCEHQMVTADGAERIFRCNGAAVTGPDGRVTLVGTAQDVTEHRAAEAIVERSSQRFADLVSITPVGIGIFDHSERLVDANDALCELLGYDLDQLRGITAEEMTHPEDRTARSRSAAWITESGEKSSKVAQRLLVRSSGEPVYCELHIAISVQDDGSRFWLVVFQDITERRRTAEALRHQATHDDLTGLPNRAAVKELLGKLLATVDPDQLAVLFCDIDNFKRVNDSLGHDAGDELLVALARRLEGGLPPHCTAARISGDEYVVICSDVAAVGGVDALATRVAGLLRAAVPVHNQLVRVSASIGAAVPTGATSTGADLLRFADAAMFEAKREGAGRVSLASAALIASADRQVHLEGQLRDALSRDGLTLHFQPVVGADGSVQTAEALVRWPHPDRGLLSPDIFLPVAEQGDLLRELDRWVLRTALREAASWPEPDGRQVGVAVNLAGLVPGVPDFVESVINAVSESGIAWDRVILELVETSLMDLPSRVLNAMGQLVDRGVRFAVDDFGTGYSSLARLKELPAQIVKVDRQFVSGVGTDPSDFAVARAVVDMARAMGRSCVAEGVETATQFHVLRGVGVDAYQGWLFSRPVPPKEFRAVLGLGPLHVPRAG
ncbi:diguanylate phosphodiesterase [Actinoalloteichus sp. AHMU CJ021]|uniref:sensor domain-containing protein n=1 Tax=Actinoalloteichus TaxID=65496 RepID=UPI000CA044AC|nr:diguanylate phosphodiesterase [Actinoalloteichus sp. AHMU CJ021]